MSKSSKVFVCLSVIVVALALLLQIDDDLNQDSKAMLDRVDWQTPNESYPYLMGMNTELGQDPRVIGDDIVAELRVLEANYSNLVSADDALSLRDRETLTLSELPHFCSLNSDESCLFNLFSQIELGSFSPEMIELRKRYWHFLAMDDFRTLSRPHIYEPFGPYSALIKANRLVSLEAIDLARSGRANEAASKLYSLIELQRYFLSKVDSLLARMIAYVLINETIDMLSIILKEYDLDGRKISVLSPNELSLRTVVSREFAYVGTAFDIVQHDPSYKNWPHWILRILMKPNMTMNTASGHYLRAIRLSEQEIPNFEPPACSPKSSWFRNSIGSLMNQTGIIGFDDYISRGFNLNVKIALFNGTLGREISIEALAEIPNPYYLQEFDADFSEDQQSVCMGGPLEDKNGYRCLSLRYD